MINCCYQFPAYACTAQSDLSTEVKDTLKKKFKSLLQIAYAIFTKLQSYCTCFPDTRISAKKGPYIPAFYLFRGDRDYKGISIESLNAIAETVQKTYSSSIINFCNNEQVIPSNWQPKSVFVLPGGTCSDWDKLLTQNQQQQIYQWFIQGEGRIFGACAGSYFCCNESEYRADNFQTIFRKRQISLFPGTCKGPVYSSMIKVVKVRWEATGKQGSVVVIGAGAFFPKNTQNSSSYKILARFIDRSEEESIAVVKCLKGNGVAVLSTPHWEFDSKHLNHMEQLFPSLAPEVDTMKKQLKESDSFRQECLSKMLAELE